MDPNTFPTKGNLILAKNSLALSRQGYELMDKKRNILIREMMNLVDQAKDIQGQIDETFRTAYTALQRANMEMGIAFVDQISHTFALFCVFLILLARRIAEFSIIDSLIESSFTLSKAAFASSRDIFVL